MKRVADESTQETDSIESQTERQDESSPSAPPAVQGVVIGVLTDVLGDGQPCVTFPGNLAVLPVNARATIPVTSEAIGSSVALMFENGDIRKPIVMGIVQSAPGNQAVGNTEPTSLTPEADNEQWTATDDTVDNAELLIDGKRVDLQAREQIVLRCGKSSITMTSAGKIIIRGAYVSTRSSGANRIKGGSVQIN